MRSRRSLGSLLAATGLAVTVLTVAPATQANAAWSDCRPGAFCLFDGGDGYRAFTDATKPQWDPNLHDNNFGDDASALWNRTGAYFCIYPDVNYQGRPYLVEPGQGPFTFTPGGVLDNTASSYSIIRSDQKDCSHPEPR